jgi:hypothetical protein
VSKALTTPDNERLELHRSSLSPAHHSKMHALLTRGSLLKVRIFEQRGEAAKWLGLPNELLEPPPDSFLVAAGAAR